MRNFKFGLCVSTLMAITLHAAAPSPRKVQAQLRSEWFGSGITVKHYREKMASSTVDREAMKVYINGLGDGIDWANVRSGHSLYCTPANLALAPENFIEILDREIKENSDRVTASELDKKYIGALLMMGLQKTFPCTNGK